MNRHLNWSNRTTEQWAWDHFSRLANWHPAFSPLRFGRQTCAVLISQVSPAWKDSGSLPPSPTLLPADGKDWYSFCVVLCAWNTEMEENDDKPSLDLLCWEIKEPWRNSNIQNNTKNQSFSVFARMLENNDHDEMRLLENKKANKNANQNKPKTSKLFGLSNSWDIVLCKAAWKATQPNQSSLLLFVFIIIISKNYGLRAVLCTWWTRTFISGISFVVSFYAFYDINQGPHTFSSLFLTHHPLHTFFLCFLTLIISIDTKLKNRKLSRIVFLLLCTESFRETAMCYLWFLCPVILFAEKRA